MNFEVHAFSYNKNLNFKLSRSISNNKINETSVTKFLGIHLDKRQNFGNHITQISVKIAKSIGFLHELNRFLAETIIGTLLHTSLINPYLSYGVEPWHGTYFLISIIFKFRTTFFNYCSSNFFK